MRRGIRLFRCLALVVLPGVLAATESAGPHYHVTARYPIGGTDTAYDYINVDPATRRVFVAHGTRLEVLSADDGKPLGQIEGLTVAHGIEFPEGLGRGFVTSGNDRAVMMFDPRTLTVLKVIKYTGVKPDALKYDPSSKLLFVVNGGSTGDVTVIDPRNAAIVATIELGGGKLEQIAFDGRGRGYVNDEKRNVVHVLDTSTLSAVGTWPLAPGEEPTGLAIDRDGHRIFAACGNNLLVSVDIGSGRVITTAPIGNDPDGAVFDPSSGRIFVSNRDGTLSVIRQESGGRLHPEQTVQTAIGARTIALDAKTGQLFLPYADVAPAPASTPREPKPRAPMVAASFGVMVVAP